MGKFAGAERGASAALHRSELRQRAASHQEGGGECDFSGQLVTFATQDQGWPNSSFHVGPSGMADLWGRSG